MLIDLLLKLAGSLLQFVLDRLPAFVLDPVVGQLGSAWSAVRPLYDLADWFAPVHEGLALIASLLLLRGALIAWYAINWFYRRIPVLGH